MHNILVERVNNNKKKKKDEEKYKIKIKKILFYQRVSQKGKCKKFLIIDLVEETLLNRKKKYKYMKVLYYFKLISTRFDLLII